MLWDHPMFEEFPTLAIKVIIALAVGEYYATCMYLSIVKVDKRSCSVT